MRTRDGNVRSKQFLLEDKRRQLGQIEAMIEEFARMIGDLDIEIAAEERRTGVSDETHFRYSTFARAARQRRDNLRASVRDLDGQKATAAAALDALALEVEAETARMERETAAGLRAAG